MTLWKRGLLTAAIPGSCVIAALLVTTAAEAKAPGQRHCYGGVCHKVMTLDETARQIGITKRVVASHYDDCRRDRHNPCGLTSSGEPFRASAPDNTASSVHPDGTILLVRNPATSLAAVVRVNNFGPFKANRQLDVSRATAEKLGFARKGVAKLDVVVLQAPTPEETRYKRLRRYEPVAGFLGRAESVDEALQRYAQARQKQRLASLDNWSCPMPATKRAPKLALLSSQMAWTQASRG